MIKTDSSGNEQWNRTFGGNGNQRAYSVIKTSDDRYVLVGDTEAFIGTSTGSSGMWMIKTDRNGTELWTYSFYRYSFDSSTIGSGRQQDEKISLVDVIFRFGIFGFVLLAILGIFGGSLRLSQIKNKKE
ncbi:MAG: hypothetical protein ACE5OZ_07715 [Candidatus Heimdallarchaeota archaeon]